MVGEQVDEQNDRDRDAVDALLDGLHAPVTPQPKPQPKPQPTPEPTPEHDYYFCHGCQTASDARTTLTATQTLPSTRESGSWENTSRTATALRARLSAR